MGSVLFIGTLYMAFIHLPAGVPLVAVFAGFFLSNGVRNVAYNTLTSRVPEQALRARFMSFQSAVQHLGAAAGAFLSSQLLTDLPDGQLGGMDRVVLVSMALTFMAPALFFLVERRVLARARMAAPLLAGVPVAAPGGAPGPEAPGGGGAMCPALAPGASDGEAGGQRVDQSGCTPPLGAR